MVSSERYSVSLIELEAEWTMADVESAHLTLDVLEDAETLATPEVKT